MAHSIVIHRIFIRIALLLTLAVALVGCASRNYTVIHIRRNERITRGLPSAQRTDPLLEKVTITFQTLNEGKKATSGVWVLAVDNTWNSTLVRSTNLAQTQDASNMYALRAAQFPPYSVRTLDLPFARSRWGYGLFASDKDTRHLLARIPPAQRRIWRKSNCEHLYFKVGLMARSALLGTTGNTFGYENQRTYSGYGGADHWDFNAFLTLYFNDGSKLVYERDNLALNSTNGRLVFTRAQ